MSELTVIGIGSPFGDDHLGWEIIDRLQNHPDIERYDGEQLNLRQCDRPGVMLLEVLRDTHHAILIDAVLNPVQPGELVCLNEHQISSDVLPLSSHGFAVAEAIKLGRQLGDLTANIMLMGITTDACAPGSFSEKLLQQLCDRVVQQIEDVLSTSVLPA